MKESLNLALTMCTELTMIGPLPIGLPFSTNKMPFIYLDGGLKNKEEILRNKAETTSLAIGDGDSYQGSDKDFDILLPVEKDVSDFAAALQVISSVVKEKKSLRVIHLHGLLGQRLDHQLALFGELALFMKSLNYAKDFQAHFYSSHDSKNREVSLFKGKLKKSHHGTFSLMALDNTTVSAQGDLQYPLHGHELKPFSSLGLSNRAFGNIELTSDKPLLLLNSYCSDD